MEEDRRQRILKLRTEVADLKASQETVRERWADAQSLADAAIRSQHPKWEYAIRDDIAENDLDAFGAVGWELVSTTSYRTGGGIGGNSVMSVHVRYVFKRRMIGENEYWDETRREVAAAALLASDYHAMEERLESLTSELQAL